ncbi:MAG: ABC transporter ATP-binding protein [Chitinispirillaceae bacterium]|nr:ABC transporter ATP-binding protein [Chitinispirillaceae bacterium]
MHAVEVDKVTKIYRKGFRAVRVPAVVDLSFSVRKGAVTGFVGPNGAGKTTTIKMMTGLVRPSAGTVRVGGVDASFPAARRGVAYLSEQPYFYHHLTVREMLRFTAHLTGLQGDEGEKEITRVLEIVELADRDALKIREMSKGMQQRLNMAQALLGRPHTLILDEPMSGMDPPGRRLFREVMGRLGGERCTIFFSTHVLDDVESLCDDVVVLQRGSLTYAGTVSTLLEEGFSGTDITTGALEQPCREALEAAGCTVTGTGDDNRECSIFVPKTTGTDTVLRLLFQHDMVPRSVVGKSMTLEELLYQRKRNTEHENDADHSG